MTTNENMIRNHGNKKETEIQTGAIYTTLFSTKNVCVLALNLHFGGLKMQTFENRIQSATFL